MINKVRLLYGDVTKYQVEAMVNVANSSLLGGGGVDEIIHRISGSRILDECQKIRNRQGGCKTGNSVIKHGESSNLFRHTMTAKMLENGADIRWIQAMLGHASIESTQMYTRRCIPSLIK